MKTMGQMVIEAVLVSLLVLFLFSGIFEDKDAGRASRCVFTGENSESLIGLHP